VKPSLRFLALAVFSWAGVRAATLGVLPGAELFRIERSEAKPPLIVATQFPPIQPVVLPSDYPEPPLPPAMTVPLIRYIQTMVDMPIVSPTPATASDLPPARQTRFLRALPPMAPVYFSELPALDQGPLSGIRGPVSRPVPPLGKGVDPHEIDRLQLATWALLRSQQTGIAGSRSLASGGQFGASQAGARLIYNFDRRLALTARMSSEVGRRGGEVSAGVRVHPLVSIPVWVTAERRQAIGKYGGGRDAFALFLEGGLYEAPLPWRFTLDTYFQGGIVDLKARDLFADGGFWVSRPVYRNVSAGFGVWGGAQPDIYRVDAGPRVTMRVRNNLRVHFDWRQKLAGNARPGSGPALTLSGDF